MSFPPNETNETDDLLPTDEPEGASSGKPLDWLSPPAPLPPNPARRASALNVRLKPADRERLDRAAAALGLSTSAYVRGLLLSPGPDVPAWRGVHQLVTSVVDTVEDLGAPDDVLGALRTFHEQFESIVVEVFSEPEEGTSSPS